MLGSNLAMLLHLSSCLRNVAHLPTEIIKVRLVTIFSFTNILNLYSKPECTLFYAEVLNCNNCNSFSL